MRLQSYNLQLETRISKKMNTGSLRKLFIASVNPPIIGTIWSKGFYSIWASRPAHMNPDSFLVYLITHPLLRPYHNLNTNSTSSYMLTISCSIHRIQTRRPSSIHYSNNTSKSISWEMSNIFRYCIYLYPAQRKQHFRPSMPVIIHWIHSPSVLGLDYKQISQHDSISFRLPHWFHSSSWSPRSWSSSSSTSLSEHCWLHQLACNLHSSWHCTCSHIPCLVQQFSPPTTL